ncbi:MAG TPA: hypothetical protein VI582_05370 [Aestuariivirga sp.]|nr:hypothetical protein [Aestuariivirga sp.]
MRKLLVSAFAVAVMAASAFTMTAPAKAGVDIDIFITPGPGYLYAPPRGYRACRAVAHDLYWRGYRNIRVVDCRGRIYAYKARKHGRWYLVQINARTGVIVNRQRIYY